MLNSYTKGSEAYSVQADFTEAEEDLKRGIRTYDDAADVACDVICGLEGELEEAKDEFEELDKECEALKKRLATTYLALPNLQLPNYYHHVLKAVQVYVSAAVAQMEPEGSNGKKIDKKTTTQHSSEQPAQK